MKRARVTRLAVGILLPIGIFASALSAAEKPGPAGVYPVEEMYVDAGGVMIYAVSFLTGEPLVIVHGGPGASHDYFLPYLVPLARTNRLIFIDERGSGKSEKLEDRSTPSRP